MHEAARPERSVEVVVARPLKPVANPPPVPVIETGVYRVASPISQVWVLAPELTAFRKLPTTYPLVRVTGVTDTLLSVFAPVLTVPAVRVSAPLTLASQFRPRAVPGLFTVSDANDTPPLVQLSVTGEPEMNPTVPVPVLKLGVTARLPPSSRVPAFRLTVPAVCVNPPGVPRVPLGRSRDPAPCIVTAAGTPVPTAPVPVHSFPTAKDPVWL